MQVTRNNQTNKLNFTENLNQAFAFPKFIVLGVGAGFDDGL